MSNYNKLLAHYDKGDTDKEQLLTEHLLEVAELSMEMGKKVGLARVSELIGLLHDLGKSNKLFQEYIRGEYLGRVNHSSSGAKALDYIENIVIEKYDIGNLINHSKIKKRSWDIYKEILQYPILSHHGLYDIINQDLNYHTNIRLDYDYNKKYNFNSNDLDYLHFLNEKYYKLNKQTVYDLYYQGFLEFLKVEEKLKEMALILDREDRTRALYFYYGALVRLLLSILKDADIYNSSNYYRQDQDKRYNDYEIGVIWRQMHEDIEGQYRRFGENPSPSELDRIRTKLAEETHTFSQKTSNGIYKLSMPVGSGKTYASLRYAINNARKFNKTRIFYCTAFLSVLEQNAFEIKEVLGDKYVLEHHSNVIQEFKENDDLEDQNEYLANEYLKESWESPVVLTTLVQFFNTMFKDRSSNIRRFSKLINSVIIIDEIQSLPTVAIYNANLMMNFLSQIMGCNIVHCTATQPNLDSRISLKYPCIYGDKGEMSMIVDIGSDSEVFKRVQYYNLLGENFDKELGTEDIIKHVIEELKREMSVLIVLNTKSAVAKIYNNLVENNQIIDLDVEVIYLTTNQCPKHRLDIINYIKKRTRNLRKGKEKRKIVCVSTKLIEAGVDIDFDLVYRSLAGVDSIIQCGGRCNREGKKDTKGRLYIMNYDKEKLGSLKELKNQQNATITALRVISNKQYDNSNLNIEKASDYYFDKLFLNAGEDERMLEYPINNRDTVLKLLTTNPDVIADYKNKHQSFPDFKIAQSFKTAAINFDLIKENNLNVITQYDNLELIDELYEAIESYNYSKIKILLNKLQQYTISIRKTDEYEKYISRELDGDILILSKEAYDKDIGLSHGELESLIY